ncbi:phosphotransferase family protein [Fusarium austroafricanum]|uniref:Phosphotransferase family protein n=1 Tax=Fusarium austroafricanum TaxID=2364996 RepID=A0A8H4JU55_9HYPO|nr:phosphotransferase family protein [Fusarium austroafricanum]
MPYPQISLEQLPQGSSVTFNDSSFFNRGPDTPTLPTPAEVLARGGLEPHPKVEGMMIRRPAVFKDLGLLVKFGEAPRVTIAEGQCLWAVRHLLPEVPVPEIYGWTQENDYTFLYVEFIDGVTLNDRWGDLSPTEKDGVCEQLKTIVTHVHRLRQAPGDQFIGSYPLILVDASRINQPLGNINRGPLGDLVFTTTNLPPAGPFSSATELHDWMSEMRLSAAKAFRPDLDPADFPDPYREMLPDDSPVTFTHADLNPVNIMVSKESPYRVIAIIDWEQCGWYPAYWEFCKAEFSTELNSDWQVEYLPRVLNEPESTDGFNSYVGIFAP